MNQFAYARKRLEHYRQNLPPGDYPPDVSRSLNCIRDHLYDPRLSVGWLMEHCCQQNHNFSSRFAHYTGQLPKQFILYHRMRAARLILTDRKIERVGVSTLAFELGFSSVSAFSKCFKRHYGITPSRWRKEARKGDM